MKKSKKKYTCWSIEEEEDYQKGEKAIQGFSAHKKLLHIESME